MFPLSAGVKKAAEKSLTHLHERAQDFGTLVLTASAEEAKFYVPQGVLSKSLRMQQDLLNCVNALRIILQDDGEMEKGAAATILKEIKEMLKMESNLYENIEGPRGG